MKSKIIFERHISFAEECINKRTAGQPFDSTIKQYFRENKRFGSRDRRRIKALCYNWFRIGSSFSNLSQSSQIALGYLVLESSLDDWMLSLFKENTLPDTWLKMKLSERLAVLEEQLNWNLESVFPDHDKISRKFDEKKFLEHVLKQPLVWIRPKDPSSFGSYLPDDVDFVKDQSGAFGFCVGSHSFLDSKKKYFEIQDLSCQLAYRKIDMNSVKNVWDCCSASGGKSLLLLDQNEKVSIYASDRRQSIMKDFRRRTQKYQHRVYTGIEDLSIQSHKIKFQNKNTLKVATESYFDLIIADVPCTGSGTWNRNPEFKVDFQHTQETFKKVQSSIVENAWPFLKVGGSLFYSTCSVFAAENEDVIRDLSIHNFEIIQSGYINGYDNNSDTMFFTEIRKI